MFQPSTQLAHLQLELPSDWIKHQMVRSIRSAALLYYTLDIQIAYPHQVLQDSQQQGIVTWNTFLQWTKKALHVWNEGSGKMYGYQDKTELGVDPHTHCYIEKWLEEEYHWARTSGDQHELACAGCSNLLLALFRMAPIRRNVWWPARGCYIKPSKRWTTIRAILMNGGNLILFGSGNENQSSCQSADMVVVVA
jgi:hypothetical protein